MGVVGEFSGEDGVVVASEVADDADEADEEDPEDARRLGRAAAPLPWACGGPSELSLAPLWRTLAPGALRTERLRKSGMELERLGVVVDDRDWAPGLCPKDTTGDSRLEDGVSAGDGLAHTSSRLRALRWPPPGSTPSRR